MFRLLSRKIGCKELPDSHVRYSCCKPSKSGDRYGFSLLLVLYLSPEINTDILSILFHKFILFRRRSMWEDHVYRLPKTPEISDGM